MTSRLNPYISFPDTARPAMEFYQSIFGGELSVNTFSEFGMEGTPHADLIMHSMLEAPNGFVLMASDTPPGVQVTKGDNISISLFGDDGDELRGYFEKLAAGGTVTMVLEKQVWGDEFGSCIDKFGINWMVNISST